MAKSNYITRQGWLALDQELKFLWKEERPKVTQAVSDAAALGDRSEDAEYIYGKRRLREIDRRVRFLSKRLEVLQIVDYHPKQEGKVFFGAWVELEDEEGEVKQWAKHDEQDSIRVTFENGEEYYTHSSNVTLYNK